MTTEVTPVLAQRVGYQVAAVMVILDQATKHIALFELDRGRFVPWLSGAIGWELTFNSQGAFGLPLPSWSFLLVMVLVTWIVVHNLPTSRRLTTATAYGLLLAGAWGNGVDRIFRAGDPGDPTFLFGHVVDFVAWGIWPRFNVADAVIGAGFVLLMWDLYRHEEA